LQTKAACILAQLESCHAGHAYHHHAAALVLQALTCQLRQPRSCSSCLLYLGLTCILQWLHTNAAGVLPCLPCQSLRCTAALTCRLRQPRSCSSCISAPVAVGRPPTSCAASDTFKVAPCMSTKCSHRSRSVRDGLSLPLNSNLFQQRNSWVEQQEGNGLCSNSSRAAAGCS
jgi:hypothetical protein